MSKTKFWSLALAGAFAVPTFAHAQFADVVTSYNTGTGFAAGFTNASAAIGAPASGGSVTPFAPPFSKSQLISIGAGGEITLQFNSPILNNGDNPYGIDFSLFANSFFVSSGGNVNGLFTHAVSATVQVSQNASTWYTLNPALAPAPGQLFPTDGAGNPQVPVNPALTLNNFTDDNLAGIRTLYAGSAGGTGYDLAWAEDANGNSVDLPDAEFVRIEVQSGLLDLDAVAETAPVPEAARTVWLLALVCGGLSWYSRRIRKMGAMTLLASAAITAANADTLTENFTTNPAADGWQIFGDSTRFQWDSTNHDMIVHWDSALPNSYFYHALPSTLTRADDFRVAFDLDLSDVASGTTPGKPSIFELAIGFINLTNATQTNYFRGADVGSPGAAVNLLEFDYFPDFISGTTNYGATIGPTIISSDDAVNYDGDTYYSGDLSFDLVTNVSYHVQMTYTAATQTLVTVMTANGQPFGPIFDSYLPDAFSPDEDFNLDQIAIISYNDGGQDPMFPEGSIRANGTVGNLVVTTPPPVANISGGFNGTAWQVQFRGRPSWSYTLERSADLKSWSAAAPAYGYLEHHQPNYHPGKTRILQWIKHSIASTPHQHRPAETDNN